MLDLSESRARVFLYCPIRFNFCALIKSAFNVLPSAPYIDHAQSHLDDLREQEYDLLEKIYFRHPQDTTAETTFRRYWRLLVRRPLSIITLREHFLHVKLTTVQIARTDELNAWYKQELQQLDSRYQDRLRLLEKIGEYEYR